MGVLSAVVAIMIPMVAAVVAPMVTSVVTPAMVRAVVMVAGTAYECHDKGNNGKFLHTHSLYHIF